eukprot:TRINITY_DN1826_c0_g1_i1.p1 TRINITY_DN1826_c0_g1~~TRINITY_DN1826_c0_g1_i1.p1  ORF type:complete len:124 (+),score=31.39 TRINITY_DN1826_c0_g1_i1:746-1117(+)
MIHTNFDGKEGLSKFRLLFSNIRDEKNQELRDELYLGEITMEELKDMNHEQLANPEAKEQREKQKEWETKARMGPEKTGGVGTFICHKCGSNSTDYYQLQTRSADEPMTTFVNCLDCGKRWRC